MDRDRYERDGSIFLVLRDQGGAVTMEAWRDGDGNPHGILGIHQAVQPGGERRPCPCEFLPGGQCHPDQGFILGHELAPDILAGYDTRAWVEMQQFFTARIESREGR